MARKKKDDVKISSAFGIEIFSRDFIFGTDIQADGKRYRIRQDINPYYPQFSMFRKKGPKIGRPENRPGFTKRVNRFNTSRPQGPRPKNARQSSKNRRK